MIHSTKVTTTMASPASVNWARMKWPSMESISWTVSASMCLLRLSSTELMIFFLKDGHQLSQNIINSVEDNRNRHMLADTVQEMDSMLGHFIRAQLTLAGLAMVVVTFVLWIMRVPYAFALGPAAGAMEFIPVVGPAIGGLAVMVVALLSGYNHMWGLLIFLLVWRAIQDYVTSPRIMGTSLELHPLTVLFGVFAGGEVAGVIGA